MTYVKSKWTHIRAIAWFQKYPIVNFDDKNNKAEWVCKQNITSQTNGNYMHPISISCVSQTYAYTECLFLCIW